MTNLIWLSDIHLNFLSDTDNRIILNHVVGKSQPGDVVVISGDIAEAPSVIFHMTKWEVELAKNNVSLKFVLGNHDYYHGSIDGVRLGMKKFLPNAWLGNINFVPVGTNSAIVGHDGWYDGIYADYYLSRLEMNDYYVIKELSYLPPTLLNDKKKRHEIIKDLSRHSANHVYNGAKLAIEQEGKTNIFIVTHVPPFVKAAWFKGKPSDSDWLPHFSSALMGDAIKKIAIEHPDVSFTVLCGHTHVGEQNNHDYMEMPNIRSITATAQYRYPVISDIFKVE